MTEYLFGIFRECWKTQYHWSFLPFWAAEPQIWFAQAEAQFAVQKIVDETKYFYVLSALDQATTSRLKDLSPTPGWSSVCSPKNCWRNKIFLCFVSPRPGNHVTIERLHHQPLSGWQIWSIESVACQNSWSQQAGTGPSPDAFPAPEWH